ncbi:MAG: hypothetical protein NTW58_03335 [Actinobacteria bacterium]|nr:hypothetical protein [Actinomycetota bacterium]
MNRAVAIDPWTARARGFLVSAWALALLLILLFSLTAPSARAGHHPEV